MSQDYCYVKPLEDDNLKIVKKNLFTRLACVTLVIFAWSTITQEFTINCFSMCTTPFNEITNTNAHMIDKCQDMEVARCFLTYYYDPIITYALTNPYRRKEKSKKIRNSTTENSKPVTQLQKIYLCVSKNSKLIHFW